MKKKILIGSLLVLTLLLLMPSIPAIHQRTIEDRTYDDFESKVMEEMETFGDDIKFPNLHSLFIMICEFRLNRGQLIMFASSGYIGPFLPLIYLRGLWLTETAMLFAISVYLITSILGWNWPNSWFP